MPLYCESMQCRHSLRLRLRFFFFFVCLCGVGVTNRPLSYTMCTHLIPINKSIDKYVVCLITTIESIHPSATDTCVSEADRPFPSPFPPPPPFLPSFFLLRH